MDGADLKTSFLSKLGAEAAPGERPIARQAMALSELLTLQGQTAALSRGTPRPCLDEAGRAKTELRRQPLLVDMLSLCGQGLMQAPAFAQKIGASAGLCEGVIAQEAGVVKVIKAAGDLHTLATAAAGEAEKEAEALGARALTKAHELCSDETKDRAERSAVELSFAEPFRLFEEKEGRAARMAERSERRLRPLLVAREKARGEVAELRLLGEFLARHKEEA